MIAGLGNPGSEYEDTRHNYGFLVIDRLCRKWRIGLSKTTPHAVYDVVTRHAQEVALIKPVTYMNRSGLAVAELLRHFGESPTNLIVVHDDLDLPMGTVKMRRQGGPGSHNGVASIVDSLGTEGFGRIRLGIGPRPEDWSGVDYVLGAFNGPEIPIVQDVIDHTCKGIETLLARGFAVAMNQVNRKPLHQAEGEAGTT
jgi:PTH1 family peptidyl-tRNA hydrolase